MVAGCQPRTPSAVPTEFIGVWETANVQYADRFFKIAPTSITFGIGDGNVETYPIVAVEEVRERNAVFHTISYRNQDGQESRLSFYYDPRDAGVIRFKQQRSIQWTKARS